MSEGIDFGAQGTEGRACATCGQPLRGEYWEANGKVVCPSCKERIDGSWSEGTPASRVLMSSALGLAAALAGAAVWWAVAKYAHIEAGIIAIGIGWLVGNAVRLGCQGRGGLPYQVMAVVLTYLSVVFAYVALGLGVISGMENLPRLFRFAVQAPFLGGGLGVILSIVIIGIGLVTAWQKNRPLVIEWSGPYAIGPSGGGPPPPLPPPGA